MVVYSSDTPRDRLERPFVLALIFLLRFRDPLGGNVEMQPPISRDLEGGLRSLTFFLSYKLFSFLWWKLLRKKKRKWDGLILEENEKKKKKGGEIIGINFM